MMNIQTALDLSPLASRDPLLVSPDDKVLERFKDTADVIERLRPDFPVHCFCPEQLSERVALFIKNGHI